MEKHQSRSVHIVKNAELAEEKRKFNAYMKEVEKTTKDLLDERKKLEENKRELQAKQDELAAKLEREAQEERERIHNAKK